MRTETHILFGRLESFYKSFVCGHVVSWETCSACNHWVFSDVLGEHCELSLDFARELTKLLRDEGVVN